jgi:hypothetical protein
MSQILTTHTETTRPPINIHQKALKTVKNAERILQELTEKIQELTAKRWGENFNPQTKDAIWNNLVIRITDAEQALQELPENTRTLHFPHEDNEVEIAKTDAVKAVKRAERALQRLADKTQELGTKKWGGTIDDAIRDKIVKIANAQQSLQELKEKIEVHIIPTYRKAAEENEYIEKLAEKIINFITTSPIFRAVVAGGVIGAGIGAAVGFGAGALPGLILGVIFGPFVGAWLTSYIAWFNEQNNDLDLKAEQSSTSPLIPDSDQDTSTPVVQDVTADVQPNFQVQQPNRQIETTSEDEDLRHCEIVGNKDVSG